MKRLSIAAAISIVLCCVFAPVSAALAEGHSPAESARPAIQLANYTDGTTIRHPVPLIRGTLADPNADSVMIINESSNRSTRKMAGLAHKGSFKVLTELVPGPNRLLIRSGKDELALTLNYKPQTNPYVVRIFYFTDNTGAAEYQTPIENDPQDYRDKLDTAAKLMQTFTAERMYDLGFGRVTFNLEIDEAGRVNVHVLRADDPAERYHKMDGLALWDYAGQLIRRQYPSRRARDLVIPAFTRFDPETIETYAHTALGGGSLALFGGANLFTWPSTIADAQKTFMDTTIIDTAKFFSDSVGRHTFWATASTTIGAALHELGHTFDLPHSTLPNDIMTRGFDMFNRVFTLVEPPHAHQDKSYEFNESQVARWDPPSAAYLKFSRWFALDEKDYSEQDKIVVTADDDSRAIRVCSDNGIGGIIIATEAGAAAAVPIDYNQPPPRRVDVPMAEFAKYSTGENPVLRIIDSQGLTKTVSLADLMPGPFVRCWRFASLTAPWTDAGSFAAIDDKKLQDIAASAASAPLSTSETAYVDFLNHFTDGPRENTAAYVVRTLVSDEPREIQIFTGSDDALRVWLNGKLITEVLTLRPVAIDSESTGARLAAGQNTLIVEVSQAAGGWGLYLRIANEKGSDLTITDDGKITELNTSPPRAK